MVLVPARKDRSLAELLMIMDDYSPIIPDAVTDYYLSRSGIECEDKAIDALAAQTFIADVATDAMQHDELRQQTSATKGNRGQVKDKRMVLTMEDLSAALGDHGINVRRPDERKPWASQSRSVVDELDEPSLTCAISKDKRMVLTMEDLSAALGDHGINVRRPDYFYESK
ncbi:transcription initiation factor TFIID 23-30kDa subunit-domain-containing protein [Cladochytrium replicatum]|nr:transcription initiation factor TFIID 23-30kDa subunit-domain-containing protein [Cladochytrium replicatum]